MKELILCFFTPSPPVTSAFQPARLTHIWTDRCKSFHLLPFSYETLKLLETRLNLHKNLLSSVRKLIRIHAAFILKSKGVLHLRRGHHCCTHMTHKLQIHFEHMQCEQNINDSRGKTELNRWKKTQTSQGKKKKPRTDAFWSMLENHNDTWIMYYSIKGKLPHVGHIGTINTQRNILLALYYAPSYFLTHIRH